MNSNFGGYDFALKRGELLTVSPSFECNAVIAATMPYAHLVR
jgi:hypothetical protein